MSVSERALQQPPLLREDLPSATLAPPPAAASWSRMAWRQFRLERRMFWRNPSAAFFNFALPLLLLGLFGAIFAGSESDLDVVVPGIAGMSVMATTFTALAMNLTALREQGVLKRMRGTPLPPSAYLTGLGANAVFNAVTQLVLVCVVGNLVFGVAWPRDPLALAVFSTLGVVCFSSLGVALSHAIPNVESAPAYTNAIFLPTVVLAGLFFDSENAPQVLHDIAVALPLTHLVDALSGAMVKDEGLASHPAALAVLAAWTVLGVALAVRGFSWHARRGD